MFRRVLKIRACAAAQISSENVKMWRTIKRITINWIHRGHWHFNPKHYSTNFITLSHAIILYASFKMNANDEKSYTLKCDYWRCLRAQMDCSSMSKCKICLMNRHCKHTKNREKIYTTQQKQQQSARLFL